MSNALKYIKQLESAGFDRTQAEAQVQMVLEVLEADLPTKSDLSLLREQIENRQNQIQISIDNLDEKLTDKLERRLVENEYRIVTRLSVFTAGALSVAVSLLAWLIKS